VYRRRTDNTMAERKRTKRTNKYLHKTKDPVTRTPLKTGNGRRCTGRVSSSYSNSDTRSVNLVANPMISHEWGKYREVHATSGTYSWSFETQIFHKGQPSHGGDRTFSNWWLQLNKQEPRVATHGKRVTPFSLPSTSNMVIWAY